MNVNVTPTGGLRFIYSDELQPLLNLGTPTVQRVSDVEPTADGRWTAAMRDGPTLGPFTLRQEALDAELAYLGEQGF